MTDSTDLNPQQKRELLAQLLRQKARDEVRVVPLSYGQRALWFLYQLDRYSPAYNLMYAAHLRSDVDRDVLHRCFQQLVDRHAALRTTYGTRDGKGVQIIHGSQAIEIETVDAVAWDQAQLDADLQHQADIPFDLEEGPVLRIRLYERSDEQHVLLITAHHIAMDFWSFDVMFDELELLYQGEMRGQPVKLPPLSVQFADYVNWQEQMLAGDEGKRLMEYWRAQLEGDLPTLELPADRPRPPLQSFEGRSLHFDLPDALSQKLIALSKTEGATLYAVLLAAFQSLLYRYTGQPDVLVGSPTAGRSRAELEPIIGYFLNPVVFRGKIEPGMTFREFLAQVRQCVVDGISNQDFPFPLLVEKFQPPRDASRSPVFQVAFGWDKPRRLGDESQEPSDPATLGLHPFALGQQGAAFDMMLMMLNMGDSLSAALQFNTALFDESTMQRFIKHFQVLLEAIAADPGQELLALPLLAPEEQQQILVDWNATDQDYPQDACLQQLIESQVERTPDAVAVEYEGRQWSYRELNERANQLARELQAMGAGPDALVGIYVDRSLEMLLGIVGILKAGAAYVPLSPGTPPDRLAYMLEESNSPVLLTQSSLLDDLPPQGGKVLCLDRDWDQIAKQDSSNLPVASKSNNLAYVIFTSGSTGRPKGVQIEHRTVVNFLLSMQREPGIDAGDILLAVTTLTFDISVLEMFLPLICGARLVIVPRAVTGDGQQLAEILQSSNASLMQATPATWRLLIEGGWSGNSKLKALCGGEALPRDLANQLVEKCGSLWNMYGPTETTIWSAVDQVHPGSGSVPIGRPIANTQIYVLDPRLEPTPIGVPGDLYIAGDGLARGYLHQADLTAEKFVSDPFRPDQRMYKTGDLARFRSDGKLDFLGRQDFQVKVRGFRIELGEIEAILNEHPQVREAVVTARQSGSRIDDKQLVGYLISETDEPPTTSQLRDHLKQQLPDYMVPALFIYLDAFPLNPAGKVDRNALPAPDMSRPELDTQFVAPRDDAETALAKVWVDVLGIKQVGVHDNFFELGGASIQSLEIAAKAADAGLEVTPALLFQYPTVAELAEALARGPEQADAPETMLEQPLPPAPLPSNDDATEQAAQAQLAAKELPQCNTIIESLGVYLPPKEVTTAEVLKGCKKPVWFPLERMTGIKARRMAGETEFSIDLAREAVAECLRNSRYSHEEIDLVVCCNITRGDQLAKLSVEPNTSIQLKRIFGFPNAEVFDITNACTGMFTAIAIVDAFIGAGLIRRGMVVSGEFVTDITRTAQLEIGGFLDPRLACLTVGDAGAALILEPAPANDVGFHELEMYTLSKYSKMCIGRLTEEPHGGPIMHVPNPMEHTSVAVRHSVMHAQYTLERSPWEADQLKHLIMHQTSDRSLRDGMREINKAFGKKICNEQNTINNIAYRGNTATTSHFVAVWDNIFNGRINSGDNVVFGITGSGQTIGTGIYTLDDLPDRLRRIRESGEPMQKRAARNEPPLPLHPPSPRVRICSTGTLPADHDVPIDTPVMCARAAERSLDGSGYDKSDIELLLFSGMLRTGYVSEPAIATMVAGELEMNDVIQNERDKKTFAFDVYNAALGTLYACQVASHMIQAGQFKTAMVVASEVEVNALYFPQHEMNLVDTASALVMDVAPDGQTGFGQFVFKYAIEHFDDRTCFGYYQDGKPLCDLHQAPEIEQRYLDTVPAAVNELLTREGLTLSQIKTILPPQISPEFHTKLAATLGVELERLVQVPGFQKDLFTSSLPYALEHLQQQGSVQAGDIGLIINVGSGVQVGCATYYF